VDRRHTYLALYRVKNLLVWVDIAAYVRRESTLCLFIGSLAAHPRINFVSVPNSMAINGPRLSAASKATRMNAIIRMLYQNTVVCTIELPSTFYNEEVYQNCILPRLEMNRSCFEVQRQALKQADRAVRSQLLGRALHVVRYNSDLVFLFLSENVAVFVGDEEEEEEVEQGDREHEESGVSRAVQNDVINGVSGASKKRKVP
jgi:hypothetical protein